MSKRKKIVNEKKLTIRYLLCTIYLIIMTVLFVSAYTQYQKYMDVPHLQDTKSTKDYAYVKISKMSEKFAYLEEKNIGIHYIIEKEDTGMWHTYLIAIDELEYNKYKDIIDYTYGRTEREPKALKVYGYPVVVNDKIKDLAISNIKNFVPKENEVVITKDNFNDYLTNSYLDTTKSREDVFNPLLTANYLALALVIILFIITLLGKESIFINVTKRKERR